MSDDVKIVRERMRDRMRSSGIDRGVAERMAEASVRRVAEKNSREQRPQPPKK